MNVYLVCTCICICKIVCRHQLPTGLPSNTFSGARCAAVILLLLLLVMMTMMVTVTAKRLMTVDDVNDDVQTKVADGFA